MFKVIVFEFILMAASVLIFRSLWIWLDACPWLHTNAGLGVSLMIGMTAGTWALFNINKGIQKRSENHG